MANVLPFLLMNDLQAARFRDDTAGDAARLDPRKIDLGQYAGYYVLPERVASDPDFAAHRDALHMLQTITLDSDAVFNAPMGDIA